jgi:hypothetical protein
LRLKRIAQDHCGGQGGHGGRDHRGHQRSRAAQAPPSVHAIAQTQTQAATQTQETQTQTQTQTQTDSDTDGDGAPSPGRRRSRGPWAAPAARCRPAQRSPAAAPSPPAAHAMRLSRGACARVVGRTSLSWGISLSWTVFLGVSFFPQKKESIAQSVASEPPRRNNLMREEPGWLGVETACAVAEALPDAPAVGHGQAPPPLMPPGSSAEGARREIAPVSRGGW